MTEQTHQEDIVVVDNINIQIDDTFIHRGTSFTVKHGEVLAIVGGSGTGKSVLLRALLRLQSIQTGLIKVFGMDITDASETDLNNIRYRWGVMFQHNALFSSLTVLENVAFPLHQFTTLDQNTIHEIALLKILIAGLPLDSANKYPAELSGGMQKRAALARGIVLDPELLLLDEPTAGLDPLSAAAFDELILNLKKTLGLTVIMVTHDLDSLWKVTDRIVFLGEKHVLAVEPIRELIKNPHPLIQEYFSGARGRTAYAQYDAKTA